MQKIFAGITMTIAAIVLSFTGSKGQTPPADSAKVLSVADFKLKIAEAKDAQLLDVLTPEEFEVGHIKGATNVNVLA